MRKLVLSLLLAGIALRAEVPVGLVLSAGGSKLLRANTETALAARAGDLLFSGDALKTESAAASFLFCPAKAVETLAPLGEVRFDAKAPKVKSGKISEQPARACTLPETVRVEAASQQHYGVTMTRGSSKPDVQPIPPEKIPAAVVAELTAIDANDPAAQVSRAVVFEKNQLIANALEVYYKLRDQWPDAIWVKAKISDLEQKLAEQASAAAAAAPGGRTFALLVGVSKYKLPELSLQFADQDAIVFSKLLESPRGGGLDPQNVLLLTDEKATTGAVRLGFQDFLKRRAGKNDTVVILIAGHGIVDGRNAYILTYDSDPQDLNSTALGVGELQSLFDDQLKRVGRVLLFADVCKAGRIGTIQNTTINSDVGHLGDAEGDLFGLLASRPREVSFEGPQFGGGHGVFSYFVIKGLEGAADENKDGVVDANELIQYVTTEVPQATANKQHPREFGAFENSLKLSDVRKPGIELAHWRVVMDSRRGEPLYLASNEPMLPQVPDNDRPPHLAAFQSAISAGRLLPDQPGNAFGALKELQAEVPPERYREISNQLRVALEDRAQETLLRYLAGDQSPQTQREFALAGSYMQAARTLTPESLFLEGREDFFDGRALLFDKKFPDAANLLENAVRIDPEGAYGYNALGIAYLEEGEFDRAIPAFRDAVRRAPHWSYPLHNEALAHVESGEYQAAIRLYQQAMRLTPQYSYLPYNLGLVYQRLNRRKEAETSYRKAMTLAPQSAAPYNALGTLKASEGKAAEAEQLYRDALQRDPKLMPARHNLAVLLAQEKKPAEAIALWRENLRQSPDYLPSRLSLAETLAGSGDAAGAIDEYRRVLASKPGYIAARVALAGLLAKSGDSEAAIKEWRVAQQADPQDPEVLEQIGDLEAARGHAAEARQAYRSAIQASEGAARKRIEKKLKAVR